jgi:hypothetical protein
MMRGGVYPLGRGHNANAMTMLMAGGVKPDVVGATDELGPKAVDYVHPIRDLHVTLLHLLGLDDNQLTTSTPAASSSSASSAARSSRN